MKVALVHDWLVTYRGGERVLEAIAEMFPQAELFTLFHVKGTMPQIIEDRPIHTSFLQRVPGIERRYRRWLPVFPTAIEAFDLSGFDLILSSSHCVAKGVKKPKGAVHISYVHAPMRYIWHLYDDYFGPGRASPPTRLIARALRPYLRGWDQKSARGVDHLIANSRHIAGRIQEFYGRTAEVVHPPVDLDRFASGQAGKGEGGYYLWLGAFAPYKRIDVAVEAFRGLDRPLWIVGSGQDESWHRSLPKNVRVLGQIPEEDVPKIYRGALALIVTAEEDFGITPLEAQASGRPVIALGRGGSLETVAPTTGLFFSDQTPASLAEAIRRFEAWLPTFDPDKARSQARLFGKDRFKRELGTKLLGWVPGPFGAKSLTSTSRSTVELP